VKTKRLQDIETFGSKRPYNKTLYDLKLAKLWGRKPWREVAKALGYTDAEVNRTISDGPGKPRRSAIWDLLIKQTRALGLRASTYQPELRVSLLPETIKAYLAGLIDCSLMLFSQKPKASVVLLLKVDSKELWNWLHRVLGKEVSLVNHTYSPSYYLASISDNRVLRSLFETTLPYLVARKDMAKLLLICLAPSKYFSVQSRIADHIEELHKLYKPRYRPKRKRSRK